MAASSDDDTSFVEGLQQQFSSASLLGTDDEGDVVVTVKDTDKAGDKKTKVEKAYAIVGGALKQSLRSVPDISLIDAALGVQQALRTSQAPSITLEEARELFDSGGAINDEATLSLLHRMGYFAEAAYRGGGEAAIHDLGEYLGSKDDIVAACWKSKVLKPAWFVAIDDASRAVVLAIRGTNDISDALTDVTAAPVAFHMASCKGKVAVHAGMLRSSLWLLQQATPSLRQALTSERCQGYRLLVTGHSLGGGCASLVAALMVEGYCAEVQGVDASPRPSGSRRSAQGAGKEGEEQQPAEEEEEEEEEALPELTQLAKDVHAYTFCPAAVGDRTFSTTYADIVTAVTMQSDLVPRFCAVSARSMLEEALTFAPAARKRLRERYDQTYTAAVLRRVHAGAASAQHHADSVAAAAQASMQRLAVRLHKHAVVASTVKGAAAAMAFTHATAAAGAKAAHDAVGAAFKSASTTFARWRKRDQVAGELAEAEEAAAERGDDEAHAVCDGGSGGEGEEGKGGGESDTTYIGALDIDVPYVCGVKLYPLGRLLMMKGVAQPLQGAVAEGTAITKEVEEEEEEEEEEQAVTSTATGDVDAFRGYVLVEVEPAEYDRVLLNKRMLRDHMLTDVLGFLGQAASLQEGDE